MDRKGPHPHPRRRSGTKSQAAGTRHLHDPSGTPPGTRGVRQPLRGWRTGWDLLGRSRSPAGRFSNVIYDAEGELWEARTLTGRAFFWGASEQEAAYAARFYLVRNRATFNRNMISDAELTLSERRRLEIESELEPCR